MPDTAIVAYERRPDPRESLNGFGAVGPLHGNAALPAVAGKRGADERAFYGDRLYTFGHWLSFCERYWGCRNVPMSRVFRSTADAHGLGVLSIRPRSS